MHTGQYWPHCSNFNIHAILHQCTYFFRTFNLLPWL